MEEEMLDELRVEFQTLQAHMFHREWEMAWLQLEYMQTMEHLMDISMWEEFIIAKRRLEWIMNSE